MHVIVLGNNPALERELGHYNIKNVDRTIARLNKKSVVFAVDKTNLPALKGLQKEIGNTLIVVDKSDSINVELFHWLMEKYKV
jgi:hypothetical protein